MAPAEELRCPNCGAPVEYKKSDSPTIRCPYCNTTIVLPKELLPPKPPPARRIDLEVNPRDQGPINRGRLILVAAGILLFISALIYIPLHLTSQAAAAMQQEEQDAAATLQAYLTAEAEATPLPEPTAVPTPAYAYPINTFGEKGIGAGKFDDARYIAVDGEQFVYVGDYEGGRVQRFDTTGKYISQFRVDSEKTIISSMAADREGRVFVAHDGFITAYNGASEEKLFEISDPRGGDYGGLFATDDGQLAAVWYEARWGFITSLEGHREELVFFDMNGKPTKTFPSFISGQTESVVIEVELAVDGRGKIYAVSFGEVLVFSPSGKYLNRFSLPAASGQIPSFGAVAVDGQGCLYLGGSGNIYVVSPDGNLIDSIPVDGYVDSFAIDLQNHIWAISRDKVVEYAPRGE